jgi:hypothetical protein
LHSIAHVSGKIGIVLDRIDHKRLLVIAQLLMARLLWKDDHGIAAGAVNTQTSNASVAVNVIRCTCVPIND